MHKIEIMGIVNVTPDSFYTSSRGLSLEESLKLAKKQMNEGADWLDIGGESTRPGALPVSEEEELTRVLPVISACVKEGAAVCVDTYKAGVAQAAIQIGARRINDISGGEDLKMRELVAKTGVETVLMHMQGCPQTMQIAPSYPNGIIQTVFQWFQERIEMFTALGIPKEKILLDPGIGFGKTAKQNVELLYALPHFKTLGCRLLIGISRKSFLAAHEKGRVAEKRLTETLAMHTLLMGDPKIARSLDSIRVHDVAEHVHLRSFLTYLSSVQEEVAS